jgi:hypothetical protein
VYVEVIRLPKRPTLKRCQSFWHEIKMLTRSL